MGQCTKDLLKEMGNVWDLHIGHKGVNKMLSLHGSNKSLVLRTRESRSVFPKLIRTNFDAHLLRNQTWRVLGARRQTVIYLFI